MDAIKAELQLTHPLNPTLHLLVLVGETSRMVLLPRPATDTKVNAILSHNFSRRSFASHSLREESKRVLIASYVEGRATTSMPERTMHLKFRGEGESNAQEWVNRR